LAVPPERVTSLEVVNVVKAPVVAVVAPTVPLMLMEAVPVRFVTTPDAGVPRAGVTSVGDVARTLLPVPVLVTLTKFLLASVATALEAVRLDRVIPLEADSVPVTTMPVELMTTLSAGLVLLGAVVLNDK
jgi:hypothetical protein